VAEDHGNPSYSRVRMCCKKTFINFAENLTLQITNINAIILFGEKMFVTAKIMWYVNKTFGHISDDYD
jgi:hypothetical protein